MINSILFLFLSILGFVSCHHYTNLDEGQYLYFEGLDKKEALLSKIEDLKNGKRNYIPLKRVFTNSKINLPSGHYLLSNECSSYEFTQESNRPKHIQMSRLQLNLTNEAYQTEQIQDENQVVPSVCYNILNQREYSYKNRIQFDILPGENHIFVSGKNLDFTLEPEKFQDLKFDLSSLSLLSTNENLESPHFFVVSQSEKKQILVSAPINGNIWLFPGKYSVEVNGTKKSLSLASHEFLKINLGMVQVDAPKNFPFQDRLKLGGQPISAFLDDKVLIRLNTSYPVFAGKYKINLEGSELDKVVDVEENKLSVVKTLGSLIRAPDCVSKGTGCVPPSKITIHENKLPFILMVEPVDQPFLVFEGKTYQYGVEGVKGIFKSLPTSSESVRSETLGLVNIKWEIRYTNSFNSTEFVRFESKGPNLFGKSVDLSFFKPSEVYLPEGDYWLTYYLGDAISQSAPKVRNEVNLSYGGTRDIVIPVYIHGLKDVQKESAVTPSNNAETSVLAPIKK